MSDNLQLKLGIELNPASDGKANQNESEPNQDKKERLHFKRNNNILI